MAQLNNPCGVFVSDGEIYIADKYNHRVRKVLRNGQIVTIAGTGIHGYNGDGQLATDAQLDHPCAVVVSSSDQVYISEFTGCRIRKIDGNGMISTIAGSGKGIYNGDDQLATNAHLFNPSGLFVTEDEEVLIADNGNHRMRKVDRNGIISTIAGNGNKGYNGDGIPATSASLKNPTSVFQYKHELYIADSNNFRIRKVDRNGTISTITITLVSNIPSWLCIQPSWQFNEITPDSLFVHHDEVYFTDGVYHVFKVFPDGTLTAVAGVRMNAGYNGDDMLATECKLFFPSGIFVDDESQIFIADAYNSRIRRIDRNGMMRTVVGTGERGYSGDVPFDFDQYPHIGPRKKSLIKPFPHAYHDLIVICEKHDQYGPITKNKYVVK